MVSFRKWLILIHRYLGLVLGLLFVVWFLSGIAMIYAGGMPSLTERSRLERLAPLDLAAVHLTPFEAAQEAGFVNPPEKAVLLTLMDRPAYRFSSGGNVVVFADTGELFIEMTPADAIKIASRFMDLPEQKLQYAGILNQADQWTITERGQLPMHKVIVDDEARTQLYISEQSAEVALITTRASRALAWVSAIPHWLYFSGLRLHDRLWRQVILWTSGVGTILAVIGIVVGILQLSLTRPFKLSRVGSYFPYSGWMRWHHVLGIVFGVFVVTWVFSGMLSMEPWFWASGGGSGEGIGESLAGGPLDLSLFPPIDALAWHRLSATQPIKEMEFLRIQSRPYYAVRRVGSQNLLVSADGLQIRGEPFPIDSLVRRAKEGNSGVALVDSQLLSDYDSYYYPRGEDPPLPVLRLKFGDADGTWFYIDPSRSRIVGRYTRRERIQRWLYNGLHSLDFSFWYYNRPLWDAGMIILNLGGAALSILGLMLGIKRIGRTVRRTVQSSRSRRAKPAV